MSTSFPSGVDAFSTKVDRGIVYHTDINNLQDAVMALETFNRPTAQGVFNVRSAEFGAVGDFSTDDTAAVQAAINAAAAVTHGSGTVTRGSVVYFPPGMYKITSTLDLSQARGVRLLGANRKYGSSYWSASTLKYTLTTATSLFDLGNSSAGALNDNITIENLTLAGSTSSIAGGTAGNHAIFATRASSLKVIGCNIHGWGGSAVRVDAGGDTQLWHVSATGCLYGAPSAQTGVVHSVSGETMMVDCNLNGPHTSKTTHSLFNSGYRAAVYINAAPIRMEWTTAAFSEIGFYIGSGVTTSPSQIANCRGEFNQGEGWVIAGFEGEYNDISAFENSIATDVTYYGIRVTGGSNTFKGVHVRGDGSSTYAQLGGVLDTQNNGATPLSRLNRYIGLPRLSLAAGAAALVSTGNTPIMVEGGQPATQTLTDGATVSVDAQAGDYCLLSAGGSRTIANPTNPYRGQVLTFDILNNTVGAITTTWSSAYKMPTWTDPATTKRKTVTFRCYDGTNYRQVGDFSGDI